MGTSYPTDLRSLSSRIQGFKLLTARLDRLESGTEMPLLMGLTHRTADLLPLVVQLSLIFVGSVATCGAAL